MTKTDRFLSVVLLVVLAVITLPGVYFFFFHVMPAWIVGLVAFNPICWFGVWFLYTACGPEYRSTK